MNRSSLALPRPRGEHHITDRPSERSAPQLENIVALREDLAILDKHADRVLFELDCLLADQARTGLRALALAPDIPTYHALLRGEAVPIEQLRPDAVTRYGLRR